MSYTIHITVNLPDDVETDIGYIEVQDVTQHIDEIMAEWNGKWTSLVVTIVNHNPPKVVKTFID